MSKKPAHMEEYFFHMKDEILKELKKQKEFYDYYRESNRLREQFPIIDKLIEGQDMGKAAELTEKERKAFKEFAGLQEDMRDMAEREYYCRGHRDCLLYLICCGILK